jgi:pimeloyl-ACP methyl ester carboxylesterase
MNRATDHRWLYLALLLGAWGTVRSTATPATDTLTVGQLTLHHCDSPAPWCGTLSRPLDPSGAVPGTVSVHFEFYPHSSPGAALGTLVATEGGPGYPATESRAEYLELFEPLRGGYDVLIMDNRGTGRSDAVDCAQLEEALTLTERNIGACGRSGGAVQHRARRR